MTGPTHVVVVAAAVVPVSVPALLRAGTTSCWRAAGGWRGSRLGGAVAAANQRAKAHARVWAIGWQRFDLRCIRWWLNAAVDVVSAFVLVVAIVVVGGGVVVVL